MRDAYDDIRAERARQIAKGRTADKDDERTSPDWEQCLAAVLRNEKDRGERAVWVKVASVAVAAIQSLDRLAEGCEAATPARLACPRCGGANRPGTVTAGTFTCAACGAVWRPAALSTPWSDAAVKACAEMLAAERESTEPHPRAAGQVWRVKYKTGLSYRVLLVSAEGDSWTVARCDEQGLTLSGPVGAVSDVDLVSAYAFEREQPDYGTVEDDGL